MEMIFQNKIIIDKTELTKYTPHQVDSLFWCFYILKYGYFKYEVDTIHNGFYIEKQEKLKYIEIIQKSKDILKNNKIKPISEITDNLANDKYISIKTFITLCLIENKQILLVDGRKIYRNILDSNNEFIDVQIIHRNSRTLEHYIELNNTIPISTYLETYYVIDGFNIKLKSISSYTISELLDIVSKLNIDIEAIKNDKNKNKLTKKDIYEIVIQNFI